MRSFWRRATRRRDDASSPSELAPIAHDLAPIAHDSPPYQGPLPDGVAQSLIAGLDRFDPTYNARLQDLGKQLSGRVVADSSGGHSGYLLRLTDGGYVAVWLDSDLRRMEFSTGAGEPPTDLIGLLSNPTIPDGSAPLDVDFPYAWEPNDISGEAGRTHGQPITGVAIGERTFSLCFPSGMELEGTVVPTADDRLSLRVWWEQW